MSKGQKKSKRILSGILICIMVLCQIAFTPGDSVSAAKKAPTISNSSLDILVGGEAVLNIKNATKASIGSWKSSDKKIASVDQKGKVKGLKKGKATITCSVRIQQKAYKLKCVVNVRVPAKSVKIKNGVHTLTVGDTCNLNTSLTPKTSNDKVVWSSSNPSIAKPDKNGKFKALKSGTVTITAKTLSGKKDSIKIEVKAKSKIKTLTKADVKNGTIKLSNASYDIVRIDRSVGTAEIILDKVKIKDALEMETNARYTVRAIESKIAKVVSLEEEFEVVSMAVDDKTVKEAPTFVAEKGTLVVTVDARGNVSVKQDGEAMIGTIKVNRSIDGNISLNIEGFEGNLVINTTSNADIDIVAKN